MVARMGARCHTSVPRYRMGVWPLPAARVSQSFHKLHWEGDRVLTPTRADPFVANRQTGAAEMARPIAQLCNVKSWSGRKNGSEDRLVKRQWTIPWRIRRCEKCDEECGKPGLMTTSDVEVVLPCFTENGDSIMGDKLSLELPNGVGGEDSLTEKGDSVMEDVDSPRLDKVD